jgi:ribonuclease P protein subunit RPR2
MLLQEHRNSVNYTAKQIARQRIQILIQQATHTYKVDPKLAQSYIWTARKIAMAARIRLPKADKRRVCKKCNTLLVPGESSRVRIKPRREPHVVVTCLKCGNLTRIPFKAKHKEKTRIEQNNLKNEATR